MAETTPDDSTGRTLQRHEAWLRLRAVIADEYAGKLPELLSIDEFARLTGMTIAHVRQATAAGELVVSLRTGERGIAPADNLAFLARERLLHLVGTERQAAAPAVAAEQRSLEVSSEAYERVWEEAVRSSVTPQEALDRLLLAHAAASTL